MSESTTQTTTNSSSSSVIQAVVSDLATYIYNNLSQISSESDMESVITAYQASIVQPSLNLSSLSVNYEANNALLMDMFQASAAWKDDLKSGVGTTLIRALATMFTYATYNIVRSGQETMLPFATLPSSIYAATNHLGVRIARCSPASFTANLTYSGTDFPYVVPAYSSFTVNGDTFYNNASITFQNNNPVAVTLYQGTINTISFTATGGSYQEYTFGNSDFSISDTDLIVTVAGNVYDRAVFNQYFSTGFWRYGSTDEVFLDTTTPDGNVTISFGNGIYGATPNLNSTISIQYCSTLGSNYAENYNGYSVASSYSSDVTGVATSAVSGGGVPLSAYDYKNLGPATYSSNGFGITSPGLNAVVRSYAGVIDGVVLTQQDFAPDDLTKMMQAQVVVLTSSTWDAGQYAVFINWLNNSSIANMIFTNVAPTPITINVTATIYCFTQTNLEDAQNKATAALINAFQLKKGILGYSRTLNDIYDILKYSSNGVDYVDLTSPTSDPTVSNNTQYIQLGNVSITADYSTRSNIGAS